MLAYIARRLFFLSLTLLGLSVVTFFISRVVPSDPARLAAGPYATEDMVQKIRQEFGLDKPLAVQYWNYISGIFRGDFGRSIRTRRPVSQDLGRFYPATLELVLFSLVVFGAIPGVMLGVLSAYYHDRWVDQLVRPISIIGLGLPGFWLALMLQSLVASKLGLLPVGGRLSLGVSSPGSITHFFLIDSLFTGNGRAFLDALKHILLPSISLAFPAFASITRLTRAEALDVLNADYVRTAWAKGVSGLRVLWRHILRNAMIPTTTMIGLRFGWMLGGTIMVETVFNWPGLGLYAVQAATFSDFNAIMGVTLLIGLNFGVANLTVDLLYGVLDPRIRYE